MDSKKQLNVVILGQKHAGKSRLRDEIFSTSKQRETKKCIINLIEGEECLSKSLNYDITEIYRMIDVNEYT